MQSPGSALYERIIGFMRPVIPADIGVDYFDGWVVRSRTRLVAALDAMLGPSAAPPPPPASFEAPVEEWTPAKRTAANLAAMRVLAEHEPGTLTPEQITTVMGYSGWGGLSIKAAAEKFPPGVPVPDPAGLIHEFYTPRRVAEAVAAAVMPLLDEQVGPVLALEPSAGIGRFIHAFAGQRGPAIQWLAAEFSPLSASILRAARPDVRLYDGPFEGWIAEEAWQYDGKIQLVVSNPPYGQRGPSRMLDPDRDTQAEKVAYAYFMERTLGLLAEGGVGVFLVPSGFMTARGARFHRLRARILRRHHLLAAFRLPSELFPGALLVTDLLFFRARGGELADVDESDQGVLEGRYFEQFPGHILGREVGKPGDDEDQTASPRWGYQVVGEFTGLPPFKPRPLCESCIGDLAPLERITAPAKVTGGISRVMDIDTTGMDDATRAAVDLGGRVDSYLSMLARSDPRATGAHGELVAALQGWVRLYGAPHEAAALVAGASAGKAPMQRFLQAFQVRSTELAPAVAATPPKERAWNGEPNDVLGQADHVYRMRDRAITITEVLDLHRAAGGRQDESEITATLASSQGWVQDHGWMPMWAFLSGDLWPRYDRMVLRVQQGDTAAADLLARLTAAIGPVTFDEIEDISPVYGWLPLTMVGQWLAKYNFDQAVELERDRGLVVVVGKEYEDMTEAANTTGRGRYYDGDIGPLAAQIIGWINHDRTVFKPRKGQKVDGVADREASADDKRIALQREWTQDFKGWVSASAERREQVTRAYNRAFKGFVAIPEDPTPMSLARWSPAAPSPRPVQWAGANRVIRHRGGLIAFDVGVGKTMTGMLVVAAARQNGWARRPVILVPNNIVWKWRNDFARMLPDYRVGVIGSVQKWRDAPMSKWRVRLATPDAVERLRRLRPRAGRAHEALAELPTDDTWVKLDRIQASLDAKTWRSLTEVAKDGAPFVELEEPPGRMVSSTDTPEQRAAKWTEFQAGLYDVMLVTYTSFSRTRMNKDRVMRYVEQHEGIQREIALQRRNAGSIKGKLTERQEAILRDGAAGWVEEQLALPEGWHYDPGIAWDDLGVDLLLVDEAQNFKNLNMPEPREGGVPRFMGNAGDGSKRAWQMDFRCASVREQAKGHGVVLLSATPAKNSPLEFYNLLQYVAPEAWTRLGIANSEMFIDRFLLIEQRAVVGTDLQVSQKPAVVGFKNLDELRSVVFMLGDFRTAAEAGITLPEPTVELVTVDMDAAQDDKYQRYIAQIEDALSDPNPSAKSEILGLMARMAMVAIHPALDEGYSWRSAPVDPDYKVSSPKFNACVERIMAQRTCGHIVFVDNVAAHRWFRETLLRAGMPEERIAVMNADTADLGERFRIAQAFNGSPEEDIDPAYDVVIANAVAYEGIDLQTRTCAIHHLDLPWEPATLEQRNGRGVRQGNKLSTIGVYYYFANRSLDGLRYNLIQGKRGWMVDLIKSQDRSTNNPGAQSNMGPDEVLLLISRDPDETRRRLEAMRERLEAEARAKLVATTIRTLAAANARFRRAERLGAPGRSPEDVVQANVERAQAEERLRDVLAVQPDLFPWARVAALARDRFVLGVEADARSLVAAHGTRWKLRSYIGDHAFAELLVDTEAGTVWSRRWGALKLDRLDLHRILPDNGPEAFEPQDWPEDEGTAMRNRILGERGRLDGRTMDILGMSWWDRWWPVIGDALVARGTSSNRYGGSVWWTVPWPIILPDGTLYTSQSPGGGPPYVGYLPTGASIIPPTTDGWSQFLNVCLGTPKLAYREADDVSYAYFGRRFPRGLLSRLATDRSP